MNIYSLEYKKNSNGECPGSFRVVFCPGLLKMAMPDGKKIMEPFLDWAEDSSLSMTWSLHIHLLNWIEREQILGLKVLDEIKHELVVASAVRWAAGNMLDAANLKK